ncbi:MAG: threonylcarbamoyl-AMP synthase [Clostridiales bacterium]|nr:threonylcarbamoyl-AMP synthase [Candidatus Equinaster intestinalis]
MHTMRLNLKYNSSIYTAACILNQGGVVAIPTETVYGLAASAFCDEAIKKVFKAKGRPQDNPLIVHIAEIEQLETVTSSVPEIAYTLSKEFWPGPLTMVLPKNDKICESVSCGLNTVAVRMPSDPVARAIIKEAGIPLAAPSANISGYPSPTCASHVLADLEGKIDAVIMGGQCSVGLESTVVSLVGTPRLLRPGAVTAEQLKKFLPDLITDSAVLSEPENNAKVASPGMKYKHYSPKTDVYLVEADSDKFADFVNENENCVAVCFDSDADIKTDFIVYGSKNDEATLAHDIFAILRDIDKKDYQAAYVHAPSKSGIGLAVYNRLIRAAAFKVIKL